MAGAIRREAFGLDYERDGTDPFYAAGLLGRLRVALAGPVAVSGLVGLTFPLRRYRFFYTAEDGSQRDLFEVAPVAVSLGLGLTVTP
jgi:hypothetical protein